MIDVLLITISTVCYIKMSMYIGNLSKQLTLIKGASRTLKTNDPRMKIMMHAMMMIILTVSLDLILVLSITKPENINRYMSWIAVFIAPLGSITNPLIYTLKHIVNKK